MNPPANTRSRGLSAETIRVLVRIALFILIAWLGLRVFPALIAQVTRAPLAVATMTTFAAGALANAVLSRAYDEGRIATVGLEWSSQSRREFGLGIAAGAGGSIAILMVALTLRMASFERIPDAAANSGGLLVVAVMLGFGAAGEELLFHGYGFLLLMRTAGDFAAILPSAVLFGLLHLGNANVTMLAIGNTIAWGVLLGYAVLKTRALWLPVGMHFGWNLMQPLLGVQLSGFTIGLTGYDLRWQAGELWSGGAYGLEGGVLTTAVVIGLFFVIRRLFPEAHSDSVVRGDAFNARSE